VTSSPNQPEQSERGRRGDALSSSHEGGPREAWWPWRRRPVDARRPLARGPFEEHRIPVVGLSPVLEGLRILHLTDLHVRRRAFRSARWKALVEGLQGVRADLVVITGDLMDAPGQEEAAAEALAGLLSAVMAAPGVSGAEIEVLGVFGNHDTPALRRLLQVRTDRDARSAPPVRWLDNAGATAVVRTPAGRTARLRVLGLSYPEDPLRAALDDRLGLGPWDLTLMLAHYPSMIFPAADLGVPLVLAGHTHGGQIRVHTRLAPHTSCDLPPGLASGCLGLRGTTCCISRGIGEGFLEGLRINCPAQVPVYILQPAPAAWGPRPQVLIPW
jgi:predicted MPP superfamily phosphohydrolase